MLDGGSKNFRLASGRETRGGMERENAMKIFSFN